MSDIKLLKKLLNKIKNGEYEPYFKELAKRDKIDAEEARHIIKDFLENRLIEAEDK